MTHTPLPKNVESIPKGLLKFLDTPFCEPNESIIMDIHKKEHIVKAMSAGHHIYFVAHLESGESMSEKLRLLTPNKSVRIPIKEINEWRSKTSTNTSQYGPTFASLSVRGGSDPFLLNTITSPTSAPPVPQRRLSTLAPFEKPYEKLKQIPFRDIPNLLHHGEWTSFTLEVRDASGHDWEFILLTSEGNIEVQIFNRSGKLAVFHSTVFVAFYVSDKYIPNAKSVQDAIMVSRAQVTFPSSEAPILNLGSLKQLRDSASDVSTTTPYVYFAYGFQPFVPKPTIEDMAVTLEFMLIKEMPRNIKVIIVSYVLEEEEFKKVRGSMRSTSLIDMNRLKVKEFSAHSRSHFQSPIPSPILPDSSSSDEDDPLKEQDETPPISHASRANATWCGDDQEEDNSSWKKPTRVRFEDDNDKDKDNN